MEANLNFTLHMHADNSTRKNEHLFVWLRKMSFEYSFSSASTGIVMPPKRTGAFLGSEQTEKRQCKTPSWTTQLKNAKTDAEHRLSVAKEQTTAARLDLVRKLGDVLVRCDDVTIASALFQSATTAMDHVRNCVDRENECVAEVVSASQDCASQVSSSSCIDTCEIEGPPSKIREANHLMVEIEPAYFSLSSNASKLFFDASWCKEKVQLDSFCGDVELPSTLLDSSNELCKQIAACFSLETFGCVKPNEALFSSMFTSLLHKFLFQHKNTGMVIGQAPVHGRRSSGEANAVICPLKSDLTPDWPVCIIEMKLDKLDDAKYQAKLYAINSWQNDQRTRPIIGLSLTPSCLCVELYIPIFYPGNERHHVLGHCVVASGSYFTPMVFVTLYALVQSLISLPNNLTPPFRHPMFFKSLWGPRDGQVFCKTDEHVFFTRVARVGDTIFKIYNTSRHWLPIVSGSSYLASIAAVKNRMSECNDGLQVFVSQINNSTFVLSYTYSVSTNAVNAKHFAALIRKIKSMHAKNLVHGDIRSSNVVFTDNTGCIILDFDFCQPIDSAYYPQGFVSDVPDVTRHENARAGNPIAAEHDWFAVASIMRELYQPCDNLNMNVWNTSITCVRDGKLCEAEQQLADGFALKAIEK